MGAATRATALNSVPSAQIRRQYEHERYISRNFPRQQDQPSNESLELSFQRGSPDEDAGGNRGLENLDGEASCRNRRDGRSPRQDQEGERARHRGGNQFDERLHNRSRGFT